MPRTKKQKTWSPADLYDGVREPMWITVGGEPLGDLVKDDLVLVDMALKKPKHGDYVARQVFDGVTLGIYDSEYEYDDPVLGIGVAFIRQSLRRKRRASALTSNKQRSAKIAELQRKLSTLERVPENEGERFKLDSEIYRLEQEGETDNEWPDLLGEGGRDGSL